MLLQLPPRRSRLEKTTPKKQQSRRARPATTTRKRSFRLLRAAVALPLQRALLLLLL